MSRVYRLRRLAGLFALLSILAGCGTPATGSTTPPGAAVPAIITAVPINAPLTEKWHNKLGRRFRSVPTVANGVVYLAMEDSCICALDAKTGQIRWKVDPPGITLTAPVVAGDQVFVAASHYHATFTGATRSPYLYAYDAQTGAIRWHYPLTGVKDEYMSEPAIQDGVLYLGSGWADRAAGGGAGGHVTALDPQTGKRLWQRETTGSLSSGVAVDADRVYFSNGTDFKRDQDSLYALDRKTQQPLWERTLDFDVSNPVTVADNTIYVTGDSQIYSTVNIQSHLVALNAADGAVRWTLQIMRTTFSEPGVANGAVYLMQNDARPRCIDNCGPPPDYKDYLLVLDAATGQIKNQVAMDIGPYPSFAFTRYGNRLYYTRAYPEAIQAIDMQTLQISQLFTSEKNLWRGLAPSADGLVFGTFDGEIYNLTLPR